MFWFSVIIFSLSFISCSYQLMALSFSWQNAVQKFDFYTQFSDSIFEAKMLVGLLRSGEFLVLKEMQSSIEFLSFLSQE